MRDCARNAAHEFQSNRLGCHGLHKFELLWKTLRIRRRAKRFLSQSRRRGVMTVRVAVFGRETRHHEIRSKFSDHPDDIRENFFPIPDAQSFLGRFGKTEIVRASEELPAVIDPPCGEQFLRCE